MYCTIGHKVESESKCEQVFCTFHALCMKKTPVPACPNCKTDDNVFRMSDKFACDGCQSVFYPNK